MARHHIRWAAQFGQLANHRPAQVRHWFQRNQGELQEKIEKNRAHPDTGYQAFE